jgi:hypothetical protein
MNKTISLYDNTENKHYELKILEYASDPDEQQLEKERIELEELNKLLCEFNELKDVGASLNKLIIDQHQNLSTVNQNIDDVEVHIENAVVQLEKAELYNKRSYFKGAIVATTVLLASFPIGIALGIKAALVVGTVGIVGGGAVMVKK